MLAELLTALAAMLGVLWQGYRTRAEVDAIRASIAPEHGEDITAKMDRLGRRVDGLAKSVGGLRDDARADREALATLHADMAARIHLLERTRPS